MSFVPENISNFNLISVLKLGWNELRKEAHPRPYHALSFRIRGESVFTVKNTETNVRNGDVLFVPRDLGYYLNAGEERLFCIHFTADNFPGDNVYRFSPVDKKYFEQLFLDTYNCWAEKKPGYHSKAASCFFKILSKIQTEQSENVYSRSRTLILNAVDYIHEHFTDPNLTVERLSEISSVSSSFFRKEFKAHMGVSPLKYINGLRVTCALEMLESGYYRIYEISEKSGFSDSKYFSTVMKKATGVSPKELKCKEKT